MKCKIVFLITAFLLLLMIFSVAQTGAKEAEAFPKAVVEQASVVFFPTITGTEVTHAFRIQNTGPVTLHILGVYTE